ncbi:hypothetical protein V5799_006100 [Amblyomma americanum]|uniref:Snake toxin/toxin-like domain-containing protein n=1 Tax=Amblyomma americanum TaxID=6943 RepID=A0AAQ4DXC9_AMBAM
MTSLNLSKTRDEARVETTELTLDGEVASVGPAGSGVRGSPGRGATTGGGGSPSAVAAAAEERQNLTCYMCNSQLEGEGCRFPHNMSLAMRRTCPPSHRFCTVIRVDYSVDPGGATRAFSIERNCSEHCTTECVAVGERLRLYLCRSCCTDSLCNTGNGARSALLEDRVAVPLLVLLAACMLA